MTVLPDGLSQEVALALDGLQYGSVQLVVHEAKVVRIERVERIRLTDTSEATTTTTGQATTTTEVRHGKRQEE